MSASLDLKTVYLVSWLRGIRLQPLQPSASPLKG